MTRDYLADARALVTTILRQNGTLNTARERTVRNVVAAVAKDLEAEDVEQAEARQLPLDT